MKRNSQRNHPALKFIGRAWAVTRPTSWTLGPLVVLLFLHQAACATKALHAIQPTAAPQHVDPGDLPQEAVRPRSDGSSHRPEPEDTENRWPYRLLAVPEMAWGGLTYPFKKAAIAYEQHDLMNRALDLFLNDERTAGVFPKFALGGTLSSGIGFTAFSVSQLKILQEVISLSVFVPFAVLYLDQPLKLDYLWAGLCLVGAVYFIFRT